LRPIARAECNRKAGLAHPKALAGPSSYVKLFERHYTSNLNDWKPPANCTVYTRKASVHQDNFGKICLYLDAGRPVVVCMELSESFYTPMANGTLAQRSPDPKTGNHAVIAVGHGVNASERCLLVRNSWGSSWGLAGHAFLNEGYLANRIFSTSVLSEI